MRVGINGVKTKRVKFSLPNSALEEEVVGDEEYEDAKAIWDDDEVKDPRDLEQGEPRDWIKEIQDEINYLRMKGIDIDEVFSVLMKIMKKVKLGVGLTNTELN